MFNKKLKKIIVILGPTACGKTDLGIKLAKEFSGEIICADSRTIYKYMDIGTAKPTGKHIRFKKYKTSIIDNIPHYMLDIVSPNKEFTVAQFKKKALKIISYIHKKNKTPIIVGGTGLYISSIVDNLKIPRVKPDIILRKKLEKIMNKRGIEFLFKKLLKLDPKAKEFVQEKNPRRIIRALEVCLKTQQPFSKLRKKGKPLFDILQIGIKHPREKLYNRIDQRTDEMIKLGLIKEIENLLKKYPTSLRCFDTIGYQEFMPYFKKNIELNKNELNKITELIKKNTKKFAKKQMTWFKKDKKIIWIDTYTQAKKLVKQFLF